MGCNMMQLSLLWPPETQGLLGHTALSESAKSDLNLVEFCKNFTVGSTQLEIMLSALSDIVYDEGTIKYRQDIFEDFIRIEGLFDGFNQIANQLKNLEYMNLNARHQEEAKLWFLFNRFKELESYVDSIVMLNQELSLYSVKSKGLNDLKQYFHSIASDSEFLTLSKIVKSVQLDIDQIHSLTLGINLDSSLNPAEVTLVSINSGVYKENNFISTVFGNFPLAKEVDLRTPTKLHRPSQDRREAILYTLYKDIEKLLNPLIQDLSDKLSKFAHIKTAGILSLISEIEFYLCGVQLIKRMTDAQLPMCRPEICARNARLCKITDLYNIGLAFSMLKGKEDLAKIVPNKVSFDENGRILIITGPNRGGKTVYTEAVGLAQLLFQAGLYVPAKYAKMSPVDNIFTHFPADENQTVTLGRLGEEAKRISVIFEKASAYSLVLLNESFTSTSYTEGLYLAKCVIQAMRYLGLRAIYNTHIHELAEAVDELNQAVDGESKIISMVSQMRNGKRSFIIEPGKPLGSSYAMDIAGKYGLDLRQLMKGIDKKKQLQKQMDAWK